jgi:hypothetical protein
LSERLRRLFRDGVAGKNPNEVHFFVLHEGIPLTPRIGEAFAVELLQLVPAALSSWPPPSATETPEIVKKQSELLQRSLFLAGHYDRRDLVKQLVTDFTDLIHAKKNDDRFKMINAVGGQCLRSLKKLGMHDEIDRFYTRLHSELLQGGTFIEIKRRYSGKPELWSSVLQTLLNLAGGWLMFGLNDRAEPILNEARNELLNPQAVKLQSKDYTELARAYVSTLGQGPSETGMARITELFRRMDDKKINNTWTTAQYYSRFHLNLVEDVIRAIVSDDFALGPGGRKWLDDDEYIVRRRIHADMKRARVQSGL